MTPRLDRGAANRRAEETGRATKAFAEPTALDFADAMAGAWRLRLHTDGNEYADEIDWPTATPGVPFAVHLVDDRGRRRCIAFDFDAVKGNAAADADSMVAVLEKAGIAYARVRSGPAGGQHILFTLSKYAVAAEVDALEAAVQSSCRTLDRGPLLGHRAAAIRPPLARHRISGRSEVVGDARVALAVLQDANSMDMWVRLLDEVGIDHLRFEAEYTRRPTDATLRSRLGGQSFGILTGSVNKDWGDRSDSGVLFTLLVALINARFTFGKAVHLCRPRAESTLERKHRRTDPVVWLHRQWVKAETWVRDHPVAGDRVTIQAEIAEFRGSVLDEAWPGMQGGSEMKVILGLVDIALTISSKTVSASGRQLAVAVGMQPRTANKALKRLIDKRWIERLSVGTLDDASVFRLTGPSTTELQERAIRNHTEGGQPTPRCRPNANFGESDFACDDEEGELIEWWDSWIGWLKLAVEHGGFRVW